MDRVYFIEMVKRIPRAKRACYVLNMYGFGYKEIAKLLKVSVGNVGRNIHEARKSLANSGVPDELVLD